MQTGAVRRRGCKQVYAVAGPNNGVPVELAKTEFLRLAKGHKLDNNPIRLEGTDY